MNATNAFIPQIAILRDSALETGNVAWKERPPGSAERHKEGVMGEGQGTCGSPEAEKAHPRAWTVRGCSEGEAAPSSEDQAELSLWQEQTGGW